MRLRGKININLKFGLNVCEENLEQAKRRMVTSTQTGELAIHPFSEKFLAEAEPGARAPRREEGA